MASRSQWQAIAAAWVATFAIVMLPMATLQFRAFWIMFMLPLFADMVVIIPDT